MVDFADIASDLSEQYLDRSLANLKNFDRVSNYECEECGDEIPEQRRKLGSVTLCVSCQSVFETKQKQRGQL